MDLSSIQSEIPIFPILNKRESNATSPGLPWRFSYFIVFNDISKSSKYKLLVGSIKLWVGKVNFFIIVSELLCLTEREIYL